MKAAGVCQTACASACASDYSSAQLSQSPACLGPIFFILRPHFRRHSRYLLDSQFYHFDCTQFDSTQTKRAISAICLTSCPATRKGSLRFTRPSCLSIWCPNLRYGKSLREWLYLKVYVLMPPRGSGLTRTDAGGGRRRCLPSRLWGAGGGWQAIILSCAIDTCVWFLCERLLRCVVVLNSDSMSSDILQFMREKAYIYIFSSPLGICYVPLKDRSQGGKYGGL